MTYIKDALFNCLKFRGLPLAMFAAGTLQADPVIYEPFAMNPGKLDGQTGGTGLGPWSGSGKLGGKSMAFGSLSTSGTKYGGDHPERWSNLGWSDFSTTLSKAGLLDHGAELWFSVLLQPRRGSNENGFVGLSSATGKLGRIFSVVPKGANVMGIWLQNGGDLQGVNAVNGKVTGWPELKYWRPKFKDNLSMINPTLVVGKFTWGSDDTAGDTLQIYLPMTDLKLPLPLETTMTTVIDQSSFRYLGVYMSDKDETAGIDEIRFGATYADVTPVDK